MDIDPESGVIGMSKLENWAIGRAEDDGGWAYENRVALFGIVRSKKAELDGFDPTSIAHGSRHSQLQYKQQRFGPVLEAMLNELAPHVDDTGIVEGAEAFLSELSD